MTMDSLLAHAESTSSTLNYLLLRLLSLHTSDLLSHIASHMGVAQTIATLLRALPYHASQRRMVIPAEITAKHGVNQEAVFRSIGSGGMDVADNGRKLEEAVFEFATIANDHVLTAREMFKEEGGKVPAKAMPLFLSMVSFPQGNFSPVLILFPDPSVIFSATARGRELQCLRTNVAEKRLETALACLERVHQSYLLSELVEGRVV
jgi:hypothetical protein